MEPVSEPLTSDATDAIRGLVNQIETVIRGKHQQIELVITCLLAGGHILIEDNPGTGKTVLARTLAQCISGGLSGDHVVFKRIQFTPDLLPMDLIGTHIFDDSTKEFIFKKVRYSVMCCWQTRSIVPLQKCKAPCWRQWRSTR